MKTLSARSLRPEKSNLDFPALFVVMYGYTMSKPKIDKNVSVPDEILKHIITPSEVRMLKNRWQIINLLEEGLSVRKVAEQVKVGTDTVVRVARMMESANLRKFLDKERRSFVRIKSKTPWIFGKSD